MRDRSKLTVLITAIGVSMLLESGGQLIFGADPEPFPELFPVREFSGGGLTVSSNQLLVIGVSAILLIGLQLIVLKTKIGTAMRAVSFNHQAASLVGINNDRIISFTFGLGSALAAAGGILYSMNYPSIEPYMGILPGLKAFVGGGAGRHRQHPGRGPGRGPARFDRDLRQRQPLFHLDRCHRLRRPDFNSAFQAGGTLGQSPA